MKCQKCEKEFEEKDLQISHDIPKYLGGTDLDGRHWLCKNCHDKYESTILIYYLSIIEEEFLEEDKITLMKEISKLSKPIKSNFRKIAKQVKEEFFNG